jgi:uncharacterized membrane protein HdeD (DUF308 family)
MANRPVDSLTAVPGVIAHHRGWFILEGIVFVLLGVFALLFPVIASITLEIYLGALLLVGGIATGIRAAVAKETPGRGRAIAVAVLTAFAGVLLLIFVPAGLVGLTMVLSACFIVRGSFEIMQGVQEKGRSGRGWLIASGVAGVIVGVLLALGLPSTALWAVGALAGISFVFTGVALLAMTAAPKAATSA